MTKTKCKIGIWGRPEAGKTTYLAALFAEEEKLISTYGYHMGYANVSKDFITIFVEEGKFPVQTGLDRENNYILELTKLRIQGEEMKGIQRTYALHLIDVAGRVTVDNQLSPYKERYKKYYEELTKCDGILVMIDPKAKSTIESIGFPSFHTALEHLFGNLPRINGKVKPYLAFCITKVDLDDLWELVEDHLDKAQLEFNFLQKVLTENMFRTIQKNCDETRVAVFATTFVGRVRTPSGLERPNIVSYGHDQRANLRVLYPDQRKIHHVITPLFWLFKCIDNNSPFSFLKRNHDFDKLETME